MAVSAVGLMCVSGVAHADDYKGSDSYLTGDWGGYRTSFLNAGIDTTVKYYADYWNVIDGGLKDGDNLVSTLDFTADIDGAAFFGIDNNKTRVRVLHIGGGNPNQNRVGSVEGIDNMEDETSTFKLYELWTEQSFASDKFRVRLGLQDVNTYFANTEMTANFMKPTFQLMPTLANSGVDGVTYYPDTTLMATFDYTPSNMYYVRGAIADGVPGSVEGHSGTHINVNSDDGAFLIMEAGITPRIYGQEYRTPNKLAVGVWKYTREEPDLVSGDKEVNNGIYLLGSYEFYGDRQGRTMGAFMRMGASDQDTHQVDFDMQTGVVARGFVPTRPVGEIGLGYTQADNSDDYLTANPTADDREYSFNAYYKDEVVPGISVQPEYQYVANPGSDPTVNSASIFGVRLELNL